MHLRFLIIAATVVTTAAFAQPNATTDTPYQIRYASNLQFGDSVVNITNSGATGAALQSGTTASITGAICVNAYAFSPDEQLVACCSCPVTPNGLVSLSVNNDLLARTLTPARPTSVVIKLLASAPIGGSCTNSAATAGVAGGGALVTGMLAWGTTLHSTATPPAAPFSVTETKFAPATLSAGELFRLTQLCTFIIANGSGFGICNSCRLGGLGAGRA